MDREIEKCCSCNSAAGSFHKEKLCRRRFSTDVGFYWQNSKIAFFHRAIYEPCALPLSHPKGGSKREFLHLALPFISSSGNRRHFKFNMWVEYSKSQPTDDKLSLKGAWSMSRDHFNFWKISDNISKTVRDSLIVSIKFE